MLNHTHLVNIWFLICDEHSHAPFIHDYHDKAPFFFSGVGWGFHFILQKNISWDWRGEVLYIFNSIKKLKNIKISFNL